LITSQIFSDTIAIDTLCGEISGKIYVIDTDTILNGGIRITAALEIILFSECAQTVNCLQSADEPYYVELKKLSTERFVGTVSKTVVVDEEYNARKDVARVLLFDTTAYVSDVNVGMGNALVNGALLASVTYLSDDEIYTVPMTVPFSEEIESPELCLGQTLAADCFVKNSRVVLTGVEGNNVIRIEAEIEIKLSAYSEEQNEIVKDLFCIERELSVERKNADCGIYRGMKWLCTPISGSVTLDADMLSVRDVVSVVSARNTVANAIAAEDAVTIEGVLSAKVIYRDENGLQSVEAEIPYSAKFEAEGVTKNDYVSACGYVTEISARVKRDREIEITAEGCFKTELYGSGEITYISEVTEGAERECGKSAVSVYIADEGESFWDAAKALSARPDELKEQNPELSEPFSAGDRIIFYRQINFELK
jgi:hypothetical protein